MDAYNPTMRRVAARRSPVPPRAQDQSQGASQGAASAASQDEEEWKAEIQESVRKAAAQAISQIRTSSSSAEIVSRIASLETRFQEVRSQRAALAQEFEEKEKDIKDALDEIRAIKIEITRLELSLIHI